MPVVKNKTKKKVVVKKTPFDTMIRNQSKSKIMKLNSDNKKKDEEIKYLKGIIKGLKNQIASMKG